MIVGSDGLEYEDLNARFQRKPAKTHHNYIVSRFQAEGKDPFYTRVWSQAYRFAEKENFGNLVAYANACASKVEADRAHNARLDEDRRLFGHPAATGTSSRRS